ncbi:MAG: hypothetical protein LBC93_07800 [Synergistaceae bacterium]|nr:hypothetical protein [Synergistaceae bacterium]
MSRTSILAELREIRESEAVKIEAGKGGVRGAVSLETCEIAAGARSMMETLMEKLKKNAVGSITIGSADTHGTFVKAERELTLAGAD